MATKWQPNGNQMVPQVKLSKVKLVDMSEKSDAFDQFWNAYPKKELKKKACAIWKRKGCDKFIVEILAFIDAAKRRIAGGRVLLNNRLPFEWRMLE